MPAAAQDVVDKSRIWHKSDGPYDLTVTMTPAEPNFGVARYDVTVLDAATRQPVQDPEVRLSATGPDAETTGWALALPTGQPATYGADINLEAPGTWDIAVNVNSSLGADFMSLSVSVPEAQRTDIGLVVYALVLLFFAFGAWRMWREARRAQSRRGPRQDVLAVDAHT
jgi:hypothetical protein